MTSPQHQFSYGDVKRLKDDALDAAREIRTMEARSTAPNAFVLVAGNGRQALAKDHHGDLWLDDFFENIPTFSSRREAEALAQAYNDKVSFNNLKVKPAPAQDFFDALLVSKKEELGQTLDILAQIDGTPWYAADAEPGSRRAWFNS
jgi:hypothetical protein